MIPRLRGSSTGRGIMKKIALALLLLLVLAAVAWTLRLDIMRLYYRRQFHQSSPEPAIRRHLPKFLEDQEVFLQLGPAG